MNLHYGVSKHQMQIEKAYRLRKGISPFRFAFDALIKSNKNGNFKNEKAAYSNLDVQVTVNPFFALNLKKIHTTLCTNNALIPK